MIRPPRRKYTFDLAEDLILDRLETIGPMTIQELVAETGKGRDAVRQAITRLHTERRVFVKDWPYQGIQRTRLWALRTGHQPDAAKPAPREMPEHQRNFRERHKKLIKARRSVPASINPFAALYR